MYVYIFWQLYLLAFHVQVKMVAQEETAPQ